METFHISTMTQISSWWSWFTLMNCRVTGQTMQSYFWGDPFLLLPKGFARHYWIMTLQHLKQSTKAAANPIIGFWFCMVYFQNCQFYDYCSQFIFPSTTYWAVCMIKDDSGEEMDRKIYFGYLAMSVLEPRNHPLQSHDEILYQNLWFGTLMCNPMQFLMSLHLRTGH